MDCISSALIHLASSWSNGWDFPQKHGDEPIVEFHLRSSTPINSGWTTVQCKLEMRTNHNRPISELVIEILCTVGSFVADRSGGSAKFNWLTGLDVCWTMAVSARILATISLIVGCLVGG